MKLMELLEQGKKATRKDFVYKYLYYNKANDAILNENNEPHLFGLKDLTRNDWYEYKEFKANFEFEEYENYYTIKNGEIRERNNNTGHLLNESLGNFNAFKDKELAEFILKKQLLERKLMVFSYLNGASEINWNDDNRKYYIDYYIEDDKNETVIIDTDWCVKLDSCSSIFFKDEETCIKAINEYTFEIREVAIMKHKLGL